MVWFGQLAAELTATYDMQQWKLKETLPTTKQVGNTVL